MVDVDQNRSDETFSMIELISSQWPVARSFCCALRWTLCDVCWFTIFRLLSIEHECTRIESIAINDLYISRRSQHFHHKQNLLILSRDGGHHSESNYFGGENFLLRCTSIQCLTSVTILTSHHACLRHILFIAGAESSEYIHQSTCHNLHVNQNETNGGSSSSTLFIRNETMRGPSKTRRRGNYLERDVGHRQRCIRFRTETSWRRFEINSVNGAFASGQEAFIDNGAFVGDGPPRGLWILDWDTSSATVPLDWRRRGILLSAVWSESWSSFSICSFSMSYAISNR